MKKDTSPDGQYAPKRHLGWMISVSIAVMSVTGCGPQASTPTSVQPAAAPVATAAAPAMAPPAVSPPPVAPQYAPVQPQAPVQQQALMQPPAPVAAGQPVPPAPPLYSSAPPPVAPSYAPPPNYAQRQPVRAVAAAHVPSDRIGRVASIEPIRERPQGSGAGGVLGGVLGAVVGNQFGHGNGRTAMTIVGAAGGAVAGNNVERNIKERVVGYRISVTLDDGASRSYEESELGSLHVGDRVRVTVTACGDFERLRVTLSGSGCAPLGSKMNPPKGSGAGLMSAPRPATSVAAFRAETTERHGHWGPRPESPAVPKCHGYRDPWTISAAFSHIDACRRPAA